MEMNGFVVERAPTVEAVRSIAARARHELDCHDFDVTLLSVDDDAGADMPESFLFEGCGRQAIYTTGDWQLTWTNIPRASYVDALVKKRDEGTSWRLVTRAGNSKLVRR